MTCVYDGNRFGLFKKKIFFYLKILNLLTKNRIIICVRFEQVQTLCFRVFDVKEEGVRGVAQIIRLTAK